jgi:cytoskeletal protein CcmA (bactofilin family)
VKGDKVVISANARAEDVCGRKILLERGAEANNVYGESITIESHCRINGEVRYTGDLRLEDHVSLAKEPRKVDSLPE